MKSMFWTNEKLCLMVAPSPSVSISCFKVHSSIGHLVWFFDNGTSIVSLRFSQKKLAKVIIFFGPLPLKLTRFQYLFFGGDATFQVFSVSKTFHIFVLWLEKTKPIIFPSGEPLTVNLYLISNIYRISHV